MWSQSAKQQWSRLIKKAVKGVPEEVNAKNELVKSISEETVDLGRVVAAIKKVEGEGEKVSDEVKAEIPQT